MLPLALVVVAAPLPRLAAAAAALLVFGVWLPVSAAAALARTPLAVYFDSTNVLHRDIQYHAESPERIRVCVQALDGYIKEQQQRDAASFPGPKIQLYDVASEIHDDTPALTGITKSHRPFSTSELQRARDMLLQTHQPDLVIQLENLCQKARERRWADGKTDGLGFMGRIDADTYVTTETFDVCLRATATWMRAVDDCWKEEDHDNNSNSEIKNKRIKAAVALTRPPGHHATFALQNGFCLYNFAAAAALHAAGSMIGCRRVCIVDWDVHYGQGCADIVRKFAARRLEKNLLDEPTIRYVSIHQTPAFPYEGEKAEIIDDVVLTLPMPPDTTWTCGYQDLWERALDFCCNESWKPDLVIVCAGYDALANDMLASCSLTARDFGCMTRRLRERVGDEVGIVIGLEGGYCLSDGGPSGNLADAVLATVRALVEEEVH